MSRRRVVLVAVAAALLLLFGGRWVAIRFTEASWYADLGLGRLYRLRLVRDTLWQLAVAVAAAGWYALQTLAVYRSIGAVHLPRRVGNLEIAEAVPPRVLRWIALGLAVLLGLVTAATFSDLPDLISLYRATVPLGVAEPVLGNDASFYLARLPLLEALHLAALLMVLFGGFVATALYAMTGSITFTERRLRMTPHARGHLLALASLLALVVAWGFQLDAYGIVGGGGSADGALAVADRSIRIPAATALAALAVVVAAGTGAMMRRTRPGILIGMWGALAFGALLGRWIAPYLADAWRGKPDAAAALALAQYADRYSRAGLGVLTGVRDEAGPSGSAVPAESLEALRLGLEGLSPWDAEPGFLDAALDAAIRDSGRAVAWTTTLDRYEGRGTEPVLVSLAVPETDVLALRRAVRPPDWAALHRGALAWAGDPLAVAAGAASTGRLRYYGAVNPPGMAFVSVMPVDRAAGRIRFLAHGAEPAVIGPEESPAAGSPAGLKLGGRLRRLLLAWALQAPPLLDRRTSMADRLLIWRDVPDRLARLYPFATFAAPRAVLADGRILWLADGYLASARFPLADRVSWDGDEINFLCAPYVAVVDAVSGATRLFLRPPDLPFAARLADGAGAAVLPSDSLGAELRQHLGYPEGLFLAQSEVLARHRGDVGAASRPWIVAPPPAAMAKGAEPAPPRATLALLAIGGEPPRLWRLLSFADAAGNALTGIVAGSARPDGSLALRLLRLPSDRFPTPAAAQGRLSLSPAVVGAAAEATGLEGSMRRGQPIAFPAAGTVAYAEFLYAAPAPDAPLMPRSVAVLAAGRIGVGDDPQAAVRALAAAREAPAADARTSVTMADARAAFLALDSAARRGDWMQFGRAWQALRRALGVDSTPHRP
jgi:uncharacterized membrane protein (UPF0182 family)